MTATSTFTHLLSSVYFEPCVYIHHDHQSFTFVLLFRLENTAVERETVGGKGRRRAHVQHVFSYRGGGLRTVSCHLGPHDQRTKSATSLTIIMLTHCAGDSVI